MTTRNIMAILCGVAFGLCACVIAESYYERFQAERLSKLIASVNIGSSEEDVRRSTGSFHLFKLAENEQVDQFRFRNFGFAILHLSPSKWVWIEVDYRNGRVTRKSFQYYEEPRCAGIVSETDKDRLPVEQLDSPDFKPRDLYVGRTEPAYVGSTEPGSVFIVKVRDTTDVPIERRKLDWRIDLNCMTAIGGCRDPRRVLIGALSDL